MLAVQLAAVVVTVQARLLFSRYPIAVLFTAGKRARRSPAGRPWPHSGACAHWTDMDTMGQCRALERKEGGVHEAGPMPAKKALLARPDGSDRTKLVQCNTRHEMSGQARVWGGPHVVRKGKGYLQSSPESPPWAKKVPGRESDIDFFVSPVICSPSPYQAVMHSMNLFVVALLSLFFSFPLL